MEIRDLEVYRAKFYDGYDPLIIATSLQQAMAYVAEVTGHGLFKSLKLVDAPVVILPTGE